MPFRGVDHVDAEEVMKVLVCWSGKEYNRKAEVWTEDRIIVIHNNIIFGSDGSRRVYWSGSATFYNRLVDWDTVLYLYWTNPLAIHTNHSLAPLIMCPHACTCACVHIHNYSHSQLHLYTFTHKHYVTLLRSLKSPYILCGNTLSHGTVPCMSIPLSWVDKNP